MRGLRDVIGYRTHRAVEAFSAGNYRWISPGKPVAKAIGAIEADKIST
jgi:hypothetical protein